MKSSKTRNGGSLDGRSYIPVLGGLIGFSGARISALSKGQAGTSGVGWEHAIRG